MCLCFYIAGAGERHQAEDLFTVVEIDLTSAVVSEHNSGESSPPSYLEALRTSRPVFLPALSRLRRCLTERDISGTNRSRERDRERVQSWLNYMSPSFLTRFRLPFSLSTRNSSTNILSSRNLRESAANDNDNDKEADESNL